MNCYQRWQTSTVISCTNTTAHSDTTCKADLWNCCLASYECSIYLLLSCRAECFCEHHWRRRAVGSYRSSDNLQSLSDSFCASKATLQSPLLHQNASPCVKCESGNPLRWHRHRCDTALSQGCDYHGAFMASVKAQLKAARAFLQDGQLQQAADACAEVLDGNPGSYEAHL
jgi:hypothetical protein